jgi:hypothetical protein
LSFQTTHQRALYRVLQGFTFVVNSTQLSA